jgi:hypothetical protein
MRIPLINDIESLKGDTVFYRKRCAAKGPSAGLDFGTILSDTSYITEKEEGASAKKIAIEALIGIIEKQVHDHSIYSYTNSNGWLYAKLPATYKQDVFIGKTSINRHRSEQGCSITPAETVDGIIEKSSKEHGIDADLIRAVIRAESDFNPKATSPRGAMGLMQLMPETARDLGIEDPYDPSQNVTAGTRYLKMLIDRYKGNVNVALAAYNWGMGNVERNPGRLPEETRNYIARINGYLEKEEA